MHKSEAGESNKMRWVSEIIQPRRVRERYEKEEERSIQEKLGNTATPLKSVGNDEGTPKAKAKEGWKASRRKNEI